MKTLCQFQKMLKRCLQGGCNTYVHGRSPLLPVLRQLCATVCSTADYPQLNMQQTSEFIRLKKIYNRLKQAGDFKELSRSDLQDTYMPAIVEEVSNILSRSHVEPEVLRYMGKLFRFLGNTTMHFYRETFFDSLSEILSKSRDENILQSVMPSFLWGCSKARYYPSSLMTLYGQYVLNNLEKFKMNELNSILYSFTKLNHPLPGLVSAFAKLILSDTELLSSRNRLAWTLAWAAMVFQEYPKDFLCSILNEEFIEACEKDDNFLLLILFQLKISLNRECPELGLGLGVETPEMSKQWATVRSCIKGISNDMFRRAYAQKLGLLRSLKRSIFGSNLHRAIRHALGDSKCVQSDAFSLSGYLFDFEVLLDANNSPIDIPIQWKYRNKESIASSIGIKLERRASKKFKISDDLISSIKEVEKNQTCSNDVEILKVSPPNVRDMEFRPSINLASDWGQKFCSPPRPIGRRILIEGDGWYHYARNCPGHVLGDSVLKRRHMKCLGWSLVSVDYHDWSKLETGSEQANYIHSLIFSG